MTPIVTEPSPPQYISDDRGKTWRVMTEQEIDNWNNKWVKTNEAE